MSTAPAGTARLFVAAWPSDEVCDLLEALARPVEPGVRYTTRAQWHVTMRFLGQSDVAEVVDALSRVVAAPTTAVLGPVVSRLGRDLVVVPVAGVDDVASAVRTATAHLGEPPGPFTGHLTIARLKQRPACGIAGARLSARFAVDAVHLVRSETLPTGARYETVASVALSSG